MKLAFSFLLSGILTAQTPYATSPEPSSVQWQIPANRGAAALWQSLKKLNTRASLLMITAHPDDEDGGMLTYESRGQGVRVDLLTLNRGEGGANVMSSDYFDALGLVRTIELLKADQHYGVNQYWTRVVDYGFSKTKAESLKMWTHDRVFYDVVRVVRLTRPLVITSVFVGAESDGHGNHQTAGALAQEVFRAAGDPNVFPDQIRAGLLPWNPLKDYARSRTGNLEIPSGQYDPLLGETYYQLAQEGLGFQKSQNHGTRIALPGPHGSRYQSFASRVPVQEKEGSLFDGIDTSLSGIASLAGAAAAPDFLKAGLAHIQERVNEATAAFSAVATQKGAPALAQGELETIGLIGKVEQSSLSAEAKYNLLHELKIKQLQFNNALIEALGLSLTSTSVPDDLPSVTPGDSFDVNLHLVNQTAQPVKVLNTSAGESTRELKDQPLDIRYSVKVPADSEPTRPYFTRPDIEQTYYDIKPNDPSANLPLSPYPFPAFAALSYHGAPIFLRQFVQSGRNTPEPLVITPAVSVSLTRHAAVLPVTSKSFPVTAIVRGAVNGTVSLTLPAGWTCEPSSAEFAPAAQGGEASATFQVTPRQLTSATYELHAVAHVKGRKYSEGYQTTGYPGLRPYFLYRPASLKITGADLKVAQGIKAAYIMGSGDEVPAALEQLGANVKLLSDVDLASADLHQFDVILLGVRTYATRDALLTYNARLLDYVKEGGVLIVQYNTPEFDHNLGPYPYQMTGNPEEVTDEVSRVQILEPNNPIFRWPNAITEKDFEGWVEERGSKWLKTWDPRYSALLETHDEGQPEQRGGLLYAQYGKGIYIYNAYAFYRQLPEGVPGAFRLFANMVSLPKNPARSK